jgi:hypothetical protein
MKKILSYALALAVFVAPTVIRILSSGGGWG